MSGWGGLFGGLGSMFGSGISAAASAKIARDNRKWQERMTKHRYQYQMQDMRAAGLNPMLAFGASPPSTPTPAMPNIPDFGASMAKGASAASQLLLQKEQARKVGNEADILGIEAYIKALGLKGIKEAEDIARDLLNERGEQLKTSARKAWRDNTRAPTLKEVFPQGPPGEAGIDWSDWQTRPPYRRKSKPHYQLQRTGRRSTYYP